MWCDNCLLIFPLRHGAMALALLIAAYSVAGGILLFKYGQFLFFLNTYEFDIYGGIAMGVAGIAALTGLGLSTESYTLARFAFLVWPLIVLAVGVRAGVMLFSLNKYQDRVVWECNNGRYLWNASAANGSVPANSTSSATLPTHFCDYGFPTVWTAFTLSLIIDFLCILYLYFCNWRYLARLRSYFAASNKGDGIYSF